MQAATLWPDMEVCSVSDLTGRIKALVEKGFSSVWVMGEVSGLARPQSGHLYFTLKDAQAQVRAVIWRTVANRLNLPLSDGLEVMVRGRVTVYPPRGEYQLVIEELQLRGRGAQELALRQLKEKLSRLGYFDPKRKKMLPRFPRRLALVTSPSGAAVRDMLEILGRRWPAAEVWICPVRVQGEGAAQEIVTALRLLNCLGGVDVVILGRGGGSREDLAVFNQENVARAIFESRMPIVSAVGHEIDVTIADLVADRRALTPSEAAELVTPHREELLHGLQATAGRLQTLLRQRLLAAWQRWQNMAERRVFRLPLDRLRELERRLDDAETRLKRAWSQRLERWQQTTSALAGRLETLSPLNVLGRGYSLTWKKSAKELLRDARQVCPGDQLETRLHQGRILSRVEEIL